MSLNTDDDSIESLRRNAIDFLRIIASKPDLLELAEHREIREIITSVQTGSFHCRNAQVDAESRIGNAKPSFSSLNQQLVAYILDFVGAFSVGDVESALHYYQLFPYGEIMLVPLTEGFEDLFNLAIKFAMDCQNLKKLKLKLNLRKITMNIGYTGDSSNCALSSILTTTGSVTELDISFNCLGLDHARSIGDALKGNTTLQILRMSRNQNIGRGGAEDIASGLKFNNALRFLDMSYNKVGPQGAEAIANSLRANTSLQHLVLSSNGIGSPGIDHLALALKDNDTLKSLVVKDNLIMSAGAPLLSEALRINKSLEVLNISENMLGTKGAKSFAEVLAQKNSLKEINISKNGIDEEGFRALSNAAEINLSINIISV